MDSDYDRYETDAPRPRRLWLRLLILFLVAFVAGAIAMGWVLTHWGAAQRYLRQAEPVAALPATLPRALPQAPQGVLAAPPGAPALPIEQRLLAIEARVGEVDRRAGDAIGNADRAEGLLVAFAARRALDRAVDLGYIEGLLRERFGGSQPQAVATIISAAHQPVTLEELQGGLEALAPALVGEGPSVSWWEGFRRELGSLVVVRRANAPSSAPADRVERARRALEVARVDIALAEISRLPTREAAAAWIAKARRYTASRSALDRIETAALLDPKSGETPVTTPPGAWTGAGE